MLADRRPVLAWGVAFLVSAAIAISYLDRQTLPWAIKAIQADFPISNQVKAALDSAFLITYGLMYLGGGWLLDRVGTRKGFQNQLVLFHGRRTSFGFPPFFLPDTLVVGAHTPGPFPTFLFVGQ